MVRCFGRKATDALLEKSDELAIGYWKLLAVIDDHKLPNAYRSACTNLMVTLYVDREPQVPKRTIAFTRIWSHEKDRVQPPVKKLVNPYEQSRTPLNTEAMWIRFWHQCLCFVGYGDFSFSFFESCCCSFTGRNSICIGAMLFCCPHKKPTAGFKDLKNVLQNHYESLGRKFDLANTEENLMSVAQVSLAR